MSVRDVIEQKLSSAFRPEYLEIANESHKHSVPPNSETHFKVVLVSESFAGQRKVARHQQVYATLAEELAGGVHALALHLYTGEEWAARQQPAPRSPDCMGGSKRDHAT